MFSSATPSAAANGHASVAPVDESDVEESFAESLRRKRKEYESRTGKHVGNRSRKSISSAAEAAHAAATTTKKQQKSEDDDDEEGERPMQSFKQVLERKRTMIKEKQRKEEAEQHVQMQHKAERQKFSRQFTTVRRGAAQNSMKRFGGSISFLVNEAPRSVSHELFCVVLPAGRGPFWRKSQNAKFRNRVLNNLLQAGLDLSVFYSVSKQEIFVRISATDARLLAQADLDEFPLELSASSIKQLAESSAFLPGRQPIILEAPFDHEHERIEQLQKWGKWTPMTDDEVTSVMQDITLVRPFDYLHARYNLEWEAFGKKHEVQIYRVLKNGTILRTVDRIKLIRSIIESSSRESATEGTRGAGLDLRGMLSRGTALAAFPLTPDTVVGEPSITDIYKGWQVWYRAPWNQPLDHIRSYFGEEIALHFCFLSHYTMWLFAIASVGVVLFIRQLANINTYTGSPNYLNAVKLSNDSGTPGLYDFSEVPENGLFSILIALWATVMLEFWKRKQATYALKWGMSQYEAVESARAEFVPTHYVPDIVSGRSTAYYSPRNLRRKLAVAALLVLMWVSLAVAAIAAIFVFKVVISLQGNAYGLDQEAATYIALVINALVIQLLSYVYRIFAEKLNDWENHRTDSEYDDTLIVKVSLFTFANSYSTLFYLAFIKSGTVILGQVQACESIALNANATAFVVNDICFASLGASLFIIFLVQIFVARSVDLFLPFFWGFVNRWIGVHRGRDRRHYQCHMAHWRRHRRQQKMAAQKKNLPPSTSMSPLRLGVSFAARSQNRRASMLSPDGNGVVDVLEDGGEDEEDEEEEENDEDAESPPPPQASSSPHGGNQQQRPSVVQHDASVRFAMKDIRLRSHLEYEFFKPNYTTTIDDYVKIFVQFGYVTLFVTAFPLAPFMAFVNCQMEIQINALKFCRGYQRPIPKSVQDIGRWQLMFTVMAYVAVFTNGGVIFFRSQIINPPTDITISAEEFRVWAFVVYVFGIFMIKGFIQYMLPDQPAEVKLQLQRQEYLVRKVLVGEHDEEPDEEFGMRATRATDRDIKLVDAHFAQLVKEMARVVKGNGVDDAIRALDTNKDGRVPSREVHRELLKSRAILDRFSKSEVELVVRALDAYATGTIHYAAFFSMA